MHRVGDVLVLIVLVALAMVLVRPGSQTAGIVRSIGSSFSQAINAATGGTAPRRNPRRGGRPR